MESTTSPTKPLNAKPSSASPRSNNGTSTPMKLYYFNIKARNYIAVVLAQAANLPIECIKVNDINEMKSSLPFGQLPYLEHGDVKIAQSGAIQRYIAKIGNLNGSNDAEFCKSEMLLAEAEDLFVGMAKANGNNDAMNEYFETSWKIQLTYLEKLIPDDSTFFVKDSRVAGGYAIGSIFDLALSLEPTALDSFPKLKTFYDELIKSSAFDGIRDWPMYLNRGPPITVGYWNIRGLAAPLRMQIMYSGVPLESVTYDIVVDPETGKSDASAWFNTKPDLKVVNPLINLPYIKDGDKLITQSNACLLYLGRKLKMLGSSECEQIKCEELLCEVMDLRNSVVGFVYSDKGTIKDEVDSYLKSNGVAKILDKLNLSKLSNAGPFFVGNKASSPDFHIFEMIDQFKIMAKVHSSDDIIQNYVALEQFHVDFRNLSKNQKYLQSKLSTYPMNGKSASLGSLPNGGKFDKTMETDWNTYDGIY